MQLIDEIKSALDGLAGQLFTQGRGVATNTVHDALERLALDYANATETAFGTHTVAHPLSQHPLSHKTLYVNRDGPPQFPGYTLGPFLFDHCWVTYYNNNAAPLLERGTKESLAGYMVRCELVMESEFNYEGKPGEEQSNQFHRDFQKVVIAKAPFKVFVFRSRNTEEGAATFTKLEAQRYCVDTCCFVERYLLSCWCDNAFMHKTFPSFQ